MKITIEQEGKEAKVFETNGIIFVANFNEHVHCKIYAEKLSVEDMAGLIFALRKMLEETKEQFPDAAKLADINSVLKGLSEIPGDDLEADEEADNDAGRV